MNAELKYYSLSFVAGMVLALLFIMLSQVFPANSTEFTSAAGLVAFAGLVGGIMYLVKK